MVLQSPRTARMGPVAGGAVHYGAWRILAGFTGERRDFLGRPGGSVAKFGLWPQALRKVITYSDGPESLVGKES